MRIVRLPFLLLFFVLALVIGCNTAPRSASGGCDLASTGLPGSRLRLRLPDGYVRPTRAPTLVDVTHGIVVSLIEGTGPSSDQADAMYQGLQKSDHLADVTKTPIHRADDDGVVITGTNADGKRVTRVALRSGAAIGCVLVVYPPEAAPLVDPIVASAWLDPKATLDPGRLNGLVIGTADGMHVIDTLTPPVMIWESTAKPPLPPSSPTLAFVVVPAPTKEHVQGVVAGILEESNVEPKSLQSTDLEIDDAPAVEILGSSTYDGVPVKFFAVLLEDPAAVIAAFGHYTKPEDLARLRAIVRSTHRVAGTLGAVRLP